MAKTTRKNSDPVHIRYKLLKNNRKSIYLDYFIGGKRKVEYLKLYLEPGTSKDVRLHNEYIMRCALNIKVERLENFAQKRDIDFGIDRSKVFLLDWIDKFVADRKRKGVRSADTNYQPLKKHITEFAPKIRLWEVNSRFLEDFVEHMCTMTCPRSKKNYAKKTVTDIVENLGVVMKAAIAADIPVNNPVPLMDRSIIHGDEKPRSYLTMDEVKKLVATPSTNERMTRLFLFSLMTGVRYSDLRSLTWSDIIEEDGKFRLEKQMRKTGKMLYLPMNATAVELLPERGENKSLVFDVPTIQALDKSLKKWVKRAGIDKNVSFHTARHSFATIGLELGSDLYTVSKLLGHSDVGVTQVYATIINPKKEEAIYKIDSLFADYLDKDPFETQDIEDNEKKE